MKKAVLTLTVYESRYGWRWHLQAANRRIIAASSEGYLERRKALKNCRNVTGLNFASPSAPGKFKREFFKGALRLAVL